MPENPKIYHIVHVDRLDSIISDSFLWCDAEVLRRQSSGTQIGMKRIKLRRLNELILSSHKDLYVGGCVPFYFCPRSIMLYLIYKSNEPELEYRDGQNPIIHLVSDFHNSVEWAEQNGCRWAFSLSNAGSHVFEDRSSIDQLSEINWKAVQAIQWSGDSVPSSIREGKQAEFLMENRFPWNLVEQIGVNTDQTLKQVMTVLSTADHCPEVKLKQAWYY